MTNEKDDNTGQGDRPYSRSEKEKAIKRRSRVDKNRTRACFKEQDPNPRDTVHKKWLEIEREIFKNKSPSELAKYNRQIVLKQLPNEKHRIFPLFCSDQVVETELFHDFEIGEEYVKYKKPQKICCATTNILKSIKNYYFLSNIMMRELAVLILFTVLLVIVISGVKVSHKRNMYNGLRDIMKYKALRNKKITELKIDYTHLTSINKVRTREEIIMFINKTFVFGNWIGKYYHKGKYPKSIIPYTRIVGTMRLRLLFVKNDSCKILDYAKKVYPDGCYASYAVKHENQSNINNSFIRPKYKINALTAMKYQKGGNFSAPFRTLYNTYGTGGYIMKVAHGREGHEQVRERLKALKITKTINNATRFVAWEFVFMDSFSKLLGLAKAYFEILPDGRFESDVSIQVAKIFHRRYREDCMILAIFVGVIVISVYFVLMIFREMCFLGFAKTITLFSTIIGLGMSMSVFAAAYYIINIIIALPSMLDMYFKQSDDYFEIDKVIYWQLKYESCLIAALLLAFLKFITYLELIENLDFFSRIMQYYAAPFVTFLFIFGGIFSALSVFAVQIFGRYDVLQFSMPQAFYLHMLKILGYFPFRSKVMNSEQYVGIILYFVSFSCVSCYMFLLINAAVFDSYTQCVSETVHRTGKSFFNKLITKAKIEMGLNKKPRLHITKDEIQDVLRIFYFTQPEIDLLFATHIIDEKNTLEPFEVCLRLLDMKGFNSDKYKEELIIEPYSNIKDIKFIEEKRSDNLLYHENIHREHKRRKQCKKNRFKVKHFHQLVEQFNEVKCLTTSVSQNVEKLLLSVQETRTRLIVDYNKYLRTRYDCKPPCKDEK